MDDNLDKSILSTICYYDVLDYPLTVFEIYKHLIANQENKNNPPKISFKDILVKLKGNNLRRFVESESGLYFMRGKISLVRKRIKRNKISYLKIKRMKRTIFWLKMVPFVRMILVTGRLAMKNAQVKSDWDVLIVLKENRIWIGRTMVTMVTHFMGKRRHHNKITNRVCLNYFITTNSLEIRNKDFYSASEYFFCFPLFDGKNYYHKFQIRNAWIRKYKPNYYLALAKHLSSSQDSYFTKFTRLILENLFDHNFLENYLEKLEVEKIIRNPNTKKTNSLVDADRKALIFLPNPRGPRVFEKFKNKLLKLNI